MVRSNGVNTTVVVAAGAVRFRRFLVFGLFVLAGACSTPPAPDGGDAVGGDASDGTNEAPVIELVEPLDDLVVSAGDSFDVRWSDSDADSNADISVFLVPADGGGNPQLMGTVKENDDGADAGPDTLTVESDELEPGDFNLLVVIDDGVNQVTSVFATDLGGALLTVRVGE